MSKVQVDKVVNLSDDGAPQLTYGAELPVGYGLTGAGGVNITGVVTATEFSGTTGTFSGNVTIGGTLTYEDVTNIDVVGVSTFAGRMNVNSSALFSEGLSVTAGVTTIAGTSTFAKATTVNATLTASEGIHVSAGVGTFANGVSVSGGEVKVGAAFSVSQAGVVTATSYYGDGSNLSNITSTTINNNADNRLITGSGTANTLEGEANLTYNGNTFSQAISSAGNGMDVIGAGDHWTSYVGSSNRSSANVWVAKFAGQWNRNDIASIACMTGPDTTNKDDGQIAFYTTTSGGSETERMRLDNAGRLIIGHTTSTGQDRIFQVIGTTSDTSAIEIRRHSADASAPKIDFSKSRNATKGSNTIVQDDDNLGQFTWRGDDGTDFTTPAATISAAVDGTPGANDMPGRLEFSTTADGANSVTERLRIDSAGKTTSYGEIALSSGGSERLNIAHVSGGDVLMKNPTAAYLALGSNNAEVIRLTNAGKFCVNATAPLNPSGNAPMMNVYNTQPTVWFETAAGGEYCMSVERSAAAGTFVQFINNSGDSCGNINNADSAASVAYSTSSDYRLKENDTPIIDGIVRVKQLRPVKFNWKETPDLVTEGFIAHEVQEAGVIGAVSGEKDATNDDGSIDAQVMDYGKLTPILTAALQEAIAKIETLETEVASLKSQINN